MHLSASYLKFIGIFVGAFLLLNYYIGCHVIAFVQPAFPGVPAFAIWTVIFLFSLSYPVSKFTSPDLGLLSDFSHTIGSYWFAVVQYLLIFCLGFDLLLLLARFMGSFASGPYNYSLVYGYFTLISISLIIIIGRYNANHPVLKTYEISIKKPAGSLSTLNAIMLSDIHLGKMVDKDRLKQLIEKLNRLTPDIVFIPGDIIDDSLEPFIRQDMANVFRQLKTKYGVFACPGNHEYLSGNMEAVNQHFAAAGITLLRDNVHKVADSLFVVGRDDYACSRFTGKPRAELPVLMREVDLSMPVILLDHQPYNLSQAESAGVDLQLSGHTHHGQLFPNNLITRSLFEIDWGYLQKTTLQVIVSCGYGTWGPPVRTGHRPELIHLKLTFEP